MSIGSLITALCVRESKFERANARFLFVNLPSADFVAVRAQLHAEAADALSWVAATMEQRIGPFVIERMVGRLACRPKLPPT